MDVVYMPQLGESITEGTITRWLKEPGDHVALYEPLCEVATDKVNAEVPAPRSGILAAVLVPTGKAIAVGEPICRLAEDTAEWNEVKKQEQDKAPAASVTEIEEEPQGGRIEPVEILLPTPLQEKSMDVLIASSSSAGAMPSRLRQRVSPVVARLATEYGIDLKEIRGTGRGGRVTRQDVWKVIEQREDEQQGEGKDSAHWDENDSSLALSEGPCSSSSSSSLWEPSSSVRKERSSLAAGQDTPLTSLRRTIATRLTESWQTVPQAWLSMEADVTNLVSLRKRTREAFQEREGISLTYLPFFLQAMALALRTHPYANAAFMEGDAKDKQGIGAGIRTYRGVHIAIAISHKQGVYTPVIRDADTLSFTGLAHAVHRLVKRTRQGKLTADDLQGGTATLNNTGSLGIVTSKPILNPPQACILAFDAIRRLPVVIEDMIAIRDRMNLSLTLDHRVLDGEAAACFLFAVKEHLESWTSTCVL